MANTTYFKVDGLSELSRRMSELSDKLEKKVARQAVAAGANVIKAAAKKNEQRHNKTGELQAAIDTRRNKQDSHQGTESRDIGVFKVSGGVYGNTRRNRQLGRAGRAVEVDPPSFYWRFLEFGTVKQAATPFLRPAFDNNIIPAIAAVSAKLDQNLLKDGQ